MRPLSPERWSVLSPFLDRALDLSGEAREAWLASLHAGDASLADDLRTLLAEHASMRSWDVLERGVAAPPTVKVHVDPAAAGQQLGAYRLVSIIGEGGMGSVWLAERCDGRFEGRAAIKLLNVSLMGPAGQERFRREGDILARLSHPNIARLADAGVSPTGQPYLVLEYVEGLPIDRYCDENGLDVDARVRLMLDVLDAIAHAHANLIVHRDVKPPNVLVAADGRVKLLDFGIARLIEGEGAGQLPGQSDAADSVPAQAAAAAATANALTRHGIALTPMYAAPEQLTGGPITTATDVYALGVLLYVLLTGQHPIGAATRSPADLVRAIVDTDPTRISDIVITFSPESPDTIALNATARATTPIKLKRRLQGDLDVIVAKALKKNPAERYASVTAFADDLRRSLRHEPIRARPDTLWYRTASFVRRHRTAMAAGAGIGLLIAGMTAFYTSRLATERDRARVEAEKSDKVKALMTSLFTAADPYSRHERAGEPTVRELLDAGAERLPKELAGQPDVQAEMMTVLGRVYQRLGLYDKAQPLLQQALALGRQVDGPEHLRVAQSLNDLGVLLDEKGDFDPAAAALEEALAMRRRLLGAEHETVAVTLVELARVYMDRTELDRAEPLLREALAIRRKVLGGDHRETATSLSDLGLLLWNRGDTKGAEALLQECMEVTRKVLPPDHPDVATSIENVAKTALDLEHYAEAERLLRQGLAIRLPAVGRTHPSVASTYSQIAHALRGQGRLDEALAALDEAMAIARINQDDDHPLITTLMVNQARVHLARGDGAAAERLLRQAMRTREHDWAPDDLRLAAARSLLGGALTRLERYDEAEPLLIEAHGRLKDARGRWGLDARDTVSRLIALYDATGRPEKAALYRASAGL